MIAKRAVGATVIGAVISGATVIGATVALAPFARADVTLTSEQACQAIRPGTLAYNLYMTELVCMTRDEASRGTPFGAESLRAAMARVFPGSYQTNPADRWSSWVIPG